jgi:hypothetical protein
LTPRPVLGHAVARPQPTVLGQRPTTSTRVFACGTAPAAAAMTKEMHETLSNSAKRRPSNRDGNLTRQFVTRQLRFVHETVDLKLRQLPVHRSQFATILAAPAGSPKPVVIVVRCQYGERVRGVLAHGIAIPAANRPARQPRRAAKRLGCSGRARPRPDTSPRDCRTGTAQ